MFAAVPPLPGPPPEVLQPRPIGPPRPTFTQRTWPLPESLAAPVALVATLVAGLVGGVTFILNRPGLGWLLCGLAVGGAALVARLTRGVTREAEPGAVWRRLESAGWALGCVALLAVTVLRANGWLAAYCLMAALACGSLALAGGRSGRALFAGAGAVLIAPFVGAPWLAASVRRMRPRAGGGTRVGLTVAITAGLLLTFGGLLTSADSAFAELLGSAVPSTGVGRPFAFLLVLGFAVGAAVLAARRPRFDADRRTPRRSARTPEWAVPLAALDLLFLAFVAVQFAVLFGGDEQVLRADGPTYADYARSGFWQLLTVTVLTLGVLAVALRVAPRDTRAQRHLLRALLGALSLLTLVIVGSAVKRMHLYEQAYGYTRLRLLVEVVELLLGLLFVLVLVALIGLRTGWLPRVAVACAVLALLGTGIADPDRIVAQRNLDRYHRTDRIDILYLAQLSPDAVPVLVCLPPDQRDRTLFEISDDLNSHPDDWRYWNHGRDRARALIADLTAHPGAAPDCG